MSERNGHPTHLPIVRWSAINGHGQSAGDTRKPLQIIELEMVAGAAIEPATRGFSTQRRARFGASKPKKREPNRGPAFGSDAWPNRNRTAQNLLRSFTLRSGPGLQDPPMKDAPAADRGFLIDPTCVPA